MNKRKVSELYIHEINIINLFPRDILKYTLSFARYSLIRFVCKRWREIDLEIKRENRRRNLSSLLKMISKNDNYSEYCDRYCRCKYFTVYSSVNIFIWYKSFDSIWSRNWDKKEWLNRENLKEEEIAFCLLNLEGNDNTYYDDKVNDEQNAHDKFKDVCIYGSIEVMKYIFDNKIAGINFVSEPCIEGCILSNNMEKVKWAYSKTEKRLNYDCRCEGSDYYKIPIEYGNTELIEYLLENGRINEEKMDFIEKMLYYDGILEEIIDHKKMNIIAMLYRNYGREVFLGNFWDRDSPLSKAIETQNLPLLKWLVEVIKVEDFTGAMEIAAEKDIRYVKYLVKHKVPITPVAVKNAAIRPKLDILRYMKSLGIEIDITYLKEKVNAAKGLTSDPHKYNEVIEWLNQQ